MSLLILGVGWGEKAIVFGGQPTWAWDFLWLLTVPPSQALLGLRVSQEEPCGSEQGKDSSPRLSPDCCSPTLNNHCFSYSTTAQEKIHLISPQQNQNVHL